VIASVHNIMKDGVFCPVDHSLELMQKNLDLYYGGDQEAWEEDYFAELMCLFDKIPEGDVIGHIDLITKYDEILSIRRSAHYYALAKKAVSHLARYGKPFEINTGAIGRGMRTTPYPSPEILRMIKEAGGRIMINSDCHNKDFLDCGFDLAVKLARECGFETQMVLTRQGWKEIPLP
jgi:histidinol-phosphatase (PHP family)